MRQPSQPSHPSSFSFYADEKAEKVATTQRKANEKAAAQQRKTAQNRRLRRLLQRHAAEEAVTQQCKADGKATAQQRQPGWQPPPPLSPTKADKADTGQRKVAEKAAKQQLQVSTEGKRLKSMQLRGEQPA